MSIKNIIQESLNKNPIGLKEALTEELRSRVAAVLESMITEKKSDDEDDSDEPYDADSKGEYDDDEDDKSSKKSKKELDESVEQIDEASVKLVMGKHQVIHKGKPVATYVAKYEAQDHAKQINDEEKTKKSKIKEEVEQIAEISTPKLAQYMKKASTNLANNSADKEFMKANLPNFTDKDERTKEKVDKTFNKVINKRKTGIATAASKISRRHYND